MTSLIYFILLLNIVKLSKDIIFNPHTTTSEFWCKDTDFKMVLELSNSNLTELLCSKGTPITNLCIRHTPATHVCTFKNLSCASLSCPCWCDVYVEHNRVALKSGLIKIPLC